MRVGAVDIGTNTVRHLVADVTSGEVTYVKAGREITRLGEGVDRDRRLHPEAVRRTLAAIERAVDVARTAGAERIRLIGTSALRDAADSEDVVRRVAERTGQTLEVIAGAEEGRLSMLGATSGLPPDDHTVLDIGGGSTELSTHAGSVSLDVGSVRLTERCLHGDPPTPDQISAARAVLDDALATVSLPLGGVLVGVAGTITTLAAVALGLQDYDRSAVHHARLTSEDVRSWSERLLRLSSEEVLALGPVEPGREDVVPAGTLILAGVMDRFGFAEVLVSESDILDGVVLDLAANR